jgi:hypothetical protein
MKAIRSAAPRRLQGEQWVGARVRASTHRIFSKLERSRMSGPPPCVYCSGTVLQHCPNLDKQLIVFGERLQPLWTQCSSGDVELLLELPQRLDDATATTNSTSSNSDDEEDVEVKEKVLAVRTSARRHSSDTSNDNASNSVSVIESSCCSLCKLGISVEDNALACNTCNRQFHDFCLPDKKLKVLNPAHAPVKTAPSYFKCFHCNGKAIFARAHVIQFYLCFYACSMP